MTVTGDAAGRARAARPLVLLLAAVTLVTTVGQVAFWGATPWPPVLLVGPVGVFTLLVPAGVLAATVLVLAGGAVVREASPARGTVVVAALAGLTLLAVGYGVVAPYLRPQGVLVAVYPGVVLACVLAVGVLARWAVG